MFEWLFGNKKELDRIKRDIELSFNSVKEDISSISKWIEYLDTKKDLHEKNISEINEKLSSIIQDIEGLKNVFAINSELNLTKTKPKKDYVPNKQTPVFTVQTGVQTGVQTLNFDLLSITERTIIWILLNSDIKLSYNDLATLLGKEKSTIRGQINTIKQKWGVIDETTEKNGKKRVFINPDIKEKLLKTIKVRVNFRKNDNLKR